MFSRVISALKAVTIWKLALVFMVLKMEAVVDFVVHHLNGPKSRELASIAALTAPIKASCCFIYSCYLLLSRLARLLTANIII